MKRGLLLSGIFLAVAAFSSCAATGPARMDHTSMSIVRCGSVPKIGRLIMVALDGFELRKPGCRVELPVGKHEIETSFIYGDGVSEWTSTENCKLRFKGTSGGVYTVNAEVQFKDKTWTAWIQDVATGERLDQCLAATGH